MEKSIRRNCSWKQKLCLRQMGKHCVPFKERHKLRPRFNVSYLKRDKKIVLKLKDKLISKHVLILND